MGSAVDDAWSVIRRQAAAALVRTFGVSRATTYRLLAEEAVPLAASM